MIKFIGPIRVYYAVKYNQVKVVQSARESGTNKVWQVYYNKLSACYADFEDIAEDYECMGYL